MIPVSIKRHVNTIQITLMNLENNKPQCDEFVVYCTWFIKSKIYIQENSPVHENIFNSLLPNNNLSQMK